MKKGETVQITVDGKTLLVGIITGTSVMTSHRASERGLKLFVLADGVKYQCWHEGAPPYTAYRSRLQPRRSA